MQKIYQITDYEKQAIYLIGSIAMIPALIVSTFLYNSFSMRTGMLIGTGLITMGSIMKMFINCSIIFLIVGLTLGGAGYPIILSAIALMPSIWFEESKRVTAINFLGGFHAIGIALGFVIPIIFIDEKIKSIEEERDEMFQSYLSQAILILIIFVLTIFTFKNEPESPPSSGAGVIRDDDIIGTYRVLFTNKEFLKLSAIFTIYYAIASTVYFNGFNIGGDFGFNHEDVLFFLCGFIGCGCLGIFIAGRLISKFKGYRFLNTFIAFGTVVNLILFGILLETEDKTGVMVVYGLFGFLIYPNHTLSFAYSTDVAFPLKETTFSGVFLLTGTILGIVTSQGLSLVMESEDGSVAFHCILMGYALIAGVISLTMKPINYDKIEAIKEMATISYKNDQTTIASTFY